VDPSLSPDQRLFRATTARYAEDACPLSTVRALSAEGVGVPAGYLEKGAGLGWFSTLVPDALDGGSISGDGLLDAAIVAEERGRALQPGAVTATNVVAQAVALGGTPAQQEAVLPRLMSGSAAAAWALAGPQGDWAPSAGVQVEREGDGFRLRGVKAFVQEAGDAEWILLDTAIDHLPIQLLVPRQAPGVEVVPLAGLDLTRRLYDVHLRDVHLPADAALLAGDESDDARVERSLQTGLVLSVAESVGAMDALFAMTVAYAKARTAFGRPIGSFQAVKHQLADLGLLVECSKAIALSAARAVQARAADAAETASIAKAFIGDSGIELSQGCLQVHGGIGYTWEYDLHLYLRRLASDAALLGDPTWHRERLCALRGL
jgi:alkylation response protein AidB-like acyl-CoA dehydrogenase